MSEFCIYERRTRGTRYDPPEVWCVMNDDHDCENCSFRCSEEEYEDN